MRMVMVLFLGFAACSADRLAGDDTGADDVGLDAALDTVAPDGVADGPSDGPASPDGPAPDGAPFGACSPEDQSGCLATESCYPEFDPNILFGTCAPTGHGEYGAVCSLPQDCAAGLACVVGLDDPVGRCTPLCHADTDCAGLDHPDSPHCEMQFGNAAGPRQYGYCRCPNGALWGKCGG